MKALRAPTLALAALVAACVAPPAAPPAPTASIAEPPAGPTTAWTGQLRCSPIPGMAMRELVQRVQLIVSGDQARFERAVRRNDTGGESEIQERAAGPVAPDGAVTLNAAVTAPGYSYNAQYAGRLPPTGNTARLTGVQHWTARTITPFDRTCTLTLRRGT